MWTMGNLNPAVLTVLGNLDPLSWLINLVKPIMLFEGEGGAEGSGEGEEAAEEEGNSKEDAEDAKILKEVSHEAGHFSEGFSEETRNHPSVKKFKSTEDMAKSYVNLETKIGAKGVIIPGEKASKEDIQAYNEALGNYTDTEKVEVMELPSGTDKRIIQTDETKQSFKDLAVKLNLNPTQSKGIQERWLEINNQALKANDATIKENSKATMVTLNKEWGVKTEENIAKANQVAKFAGGDDLLNWLDKGEGNNPIVIKALARIGSKLGEDTLGERGIGGLAKTPQEAKIEIQQIRDNPKSAFNDGNHRDHKEAVSYMSSLYAMANPDK